MAEDRVWRIWRTDTHHKVILSRRLWETEAVHGRAAAIANGITHSSRMNCGSRTVAVAGEDRKDSMVLCARQRLFRLGSEHGQARRYLCLTTQGRPIADTRGNPGLLPRHAVRYGIVTYGLLYGPLFHRTNCKTSLKHFPDMQQYTSSSDREISNHVCPVPPHKSSAAPWPRLAQASGASPTMGTSGRNLLSHYKRASIHFCLVPGGLHVYTGQVCCMGQVRLPAAPVPPSPSVVTVDLDSSSPPHVPLDLLLLASLHQPGLISAPFSPVPSRSLEPPAEPVTPALLLTWLAGCGPRSSSSFATPRPNLAPSIRRPGHCPDFFNTLLSWLG